MKILHIIPSLNIGGAERFVVDLASLQVYEHDVFLMVFHNVEDNNTLKNDISGKVNFINLQKKKGFDFFLIFRLWKIIRKLKPDVVHTHLNSLVYCMAIIFFTNIKFIHTVHNLANKENKFIFRIFNFFVLRLSNINFVAISDAVGRSIKKCYMLKDMPTIIPNGAKIRENIVPINREIDHDLKHIKDNIASDILILSVGRICKQKNQKLLISVIIDLINEGHKISFILLGDGTIKAKQELNDLIPYNIKSKINILGNKNNIWDYLNIADLFVLSSIYEGLPISLLEATSAGLYSVCTEVGGVPDVIKSKEIGIMCGLSKSELKSAILSGIEIKSASSFDQKIIKDYFFLNFSIEKCSKKYELIYE